MKQEFLIMNIKDKERMEAYHPENIQMDFMDIENSNCFRVSFTVKGDNENSAKLLSLITEYVTANYSITMLEDGCSSYFNKRLYPLISEFERKLRKLLYLTCAVSKNEKATKNITNLESKDFGQVFSILFIDSDFMTSVKDAIKTRNKDSFTKDEIRALIDSIDENTSWDILLGKDVVPSLRSRFNDVRLYRNDVMHSHSMSWKRFNDAHRLFKNINKEIDLAIQSNYGITEELSADIEFNENLGNAIHNYDTQTSLSDLLYKTGTLQLSPEMLAFQDQIKNIGMNSFQLKPEIAESFSTMWKMLAGQYQLSPEVKNTMKLLASAQVEIPPAIKALNEVAKTLVGPTPPAIANLQKTLSRLMIDSSVYSNLPEVENTHVQKEK